MAGKESLFKGLQMKDSASAAVIGLIAGYMIHRHWQELQWLVRWLFG